jgi:putative transposase
MKKDTTGPIVWPAGSADSLAGSPQDVLTEILRDGAQRLLATAVEAEVAGYIDQHADHVDEQGHRLVVRNGHHRERTIQTGLGSVAVKAPRVEDRRAVGRNEDGESIDQAGRPVERFHSKILPPYLRRTKSIEELIPWLYLKGISTGDFSEALAALLGSDAPGLSASTVVRLKEVWQHEYAVWIKRSLADQRYVYFWVDGVHFNIRLEDTENQRQCILVVMGATPEGKKELVAVQDGYRESEQSWKELLLDLKARGLEHGPELAIGDGALGFWKAIRQVYGETREQRCWVHKTANVLNELPKGKQPKAKSMLHDIWMAETKAEAQKAFDLFVGTFQAKYPKAADCLAKDREVLLTFYDFPAEHWVHIRTTNPIESTFATVRLRSAKTKGCGSRIACLTMVFKLTQSAELSWRPLNGSNLLPDVIQGVRFVDGLKQQAA